MRRGALLAAMMAGVSAAPGDRVLASIDLRKSFGTRGDWTITATQGPDQLNPFVEDTEPGPVHACLSGDAGRTCAAAIDNALYEPEDDATTPFNVAHDLQRLSIVHPRPESPLLLIRLASLHSINGNQRIVTLLLRYDRANDRFVPAYRRLVGHNNNEEVRYVDTGPLRGSVIAAVPTDDAPFGFWVTLSRPDAGGTYRQTLRYRSATRYDDGNALAVIDSEMPAIERHLGVWRSGLPLPTPAHCPAPRLVRMELWCAPPTHEHVW